MQSQEKAISIAGYASSFPQRKKNVILEGFAFGHKELWGETEGPLDKPQLSFGNRSFY